MLIVKIIFAVSLVFTLVGCKTIKEEAVVIDIYKETEAVFLSGSETKWYMTVEFGDGQRCKKEGREYFIGEKAMFTRTLHENGNKHCNSKII